MAFDFNFTASKLAEALPNIKDPISWMESVNKLLPVYNITTKLRVAMFLAQTGHESGNWNILEENLFYSAEGLLKVFPKYYPTRTLAEAHAKKPTLIANHVYCNRMGNGPEASSEGYKYRGRGILQVTGKNNYTSCSTALYGDTRLIDKPELLSSKDGAIGSACWFWNRNLLNADSDKGDIVSVTKKVNGGTNGLDDRKARYAAIMKIL